MNENEIEFELIEAEIDGETEPSGGGGFVAGLLLGLLGGVALAVIAAPQSGEETRGLLRARAREAADKARDRAGDVGSTINGRANELLERGRRIVDAARTRVDAAYAEGKDAAQQQRIELESRT